MVQAGLSPAWGPRADRTPGFPALARRRTAPGPRRAACRRQAEPTATAVEIEREGEPIVNVLDGPFVRLHGRPSFAGTGPGGFRNSARPLLFCTLLRTGNSLFPRSQA